MSDNKDMQNKTEDTNVPSTEQAENTQRGEDQHESSQAETVNTQQDESSNVETQDKETDVSSDEERQRQRMINAGIPLEPNSRDAVIKEQEQRTGGPGVSTSEQTEVPNEEVATTHLEEMNMPKHDFIPSSFDKFRPRFKVQMIVPVSPMDSIGKTIEIEGEEYRLSNTLARKSSKGAKGVLYDAVTEVMTAVEKENALNYVYLADSITKASLLERICQLVDEQIVFDTLLPVEDWFETIGQAPALSVSPSINGDEILISMVIPSPVICNSKDKEATVAKLVEFVQRNFVDAYEDVDVDFILVSNFEDVYRNTDIADMFKSIEEDFEVNVLGNIVQSIEQMLQDELSSNLAESFDEDEDEEFNEDTDEDTDEDDDESVDEDDEDDDSSIEEDEDDSELDLDQFGFTIPSDFASFIAALEDAGLSGMALIAARSLSSESSDDDDE